MRGTSNSAGRVGTSQSVRFVMDRVDGPDDRYENGLAYGLCDIAVVDDPREDSIDTGPALIYGRD